MLFRRALGGSDVDSAVDELLLTEVDHRNFVDISRTKVSSLLGTRSPV